MDTVSIFLIQGNAAKYENFVSRFWARVENRGGDGCWEWIDNRKHKEYGRLYESVTGKELRAHRIAFELAYGPIPDGLFVCHVCDNPACVRNDDEGWYELNGILHPRRGHLFLGTGKDNALDKIGKRRDQNQKKTHCPHGHEYTPENTIIVGASRGEPARRCRTCHAAYHAAYKRTPKGAEDAREYMKEYNRRTKKNR